MKVEVTTHSWCEGCQNLKIKETRLQSLGTGGSINFRTCENYDICKNAVKLYKKSNSLD